MIVSRTATTLHDNHLQTPPPGEAHQVAHRRWPFSQPPSARYVRRADGGINHWTPEQLPDGGWTHPPPQNANGAYADELERQFHLQQHHNERQAYIAQLPVADDSAVQPSEHETKNPESSQRLPWAVLAVDIETHGWPDMPPYLDKNGCEALNDYSIDEEVYVDGPLGRVWKPPPKPEYARNAFGKQIRANVPSVHVGQFDKMRTVNATLACLESRVVHLGWCVFAADGTLLHARERYVSDAPPCQKRATEVHKLDDKFLWTHGVPIRSALDDFAADLKRLEHDGGVLVGHLLEFDAGVLLREYERAALDDAALRLTRLAKAGVCTMQAAACDTNYGRNARCMRPSTHEQLRNTYRDDIYPVSVDKAAGAYKVPLPAGYHRHRHAALYDAKLTGVVYFAMLGRSCPVEL